MKRVTAIATATVLALLVALTFSAAAQQPDTHDLTIMTFSNAVELPGTRLEPGSYVFRIADTPGRNVIQVLDEDQKDMLGQWLFVPAERLDVTEDTVITFRETSAGSTPAVQYWYYPGEKIGKEFIYPKDQAMRIAQRTGATVLTDDGPVTASGQASASADTRGSAQAEEVTRQPAQEHTSVAVDLPKSGVVEGGGLPPSREAVGTSGRSEQTETVGTAGRAEPAEPAPVAQNELPATGSPLPLSGLLALFSLAGAAGIRAFRL